MLSLNSEPRSFWHALPAGPKLLALLLATGLAMWLPSAAAAAMAFLGVMGLYALAGWAFLRQGLLALRPVLFVAALILAWHGWALSWEQGGLVVARMLASPRCLPPRSAPCISRRVRRSWAGSPTPSSEMVSTMRSSA